MTEAAEQMPVGEMSSINHQDMVLRSGSPRGEPQRSFRPTPVQPQGALSTEVQGLNTDLDELRAVAGKLHETLFGSDREGTSYQAPTDTGGVAGGIKTAKTKIAAIKEQLTRITARV